MSFYAINIESIMFNVPVCQANWLTITNGATACHNTIQPV